MSARIATIALAATLVSSQAFASGEFEYTISEPTAVTTYGTTTYQGNVGTTQGQMDVFQTQTMAVDNTNTGGFGELVYDAQPYMPGATTGTTESYTSQGIQNYTTETYTGNVGTTTYQPAMEQETDASWK